MCEQGAWGADVQLVAVQYLDVAAQQGFVLARVGAREQNAMGAKDQCVISGAIMVYDESHQLVLTVCVWCWHTYWETS